MAGYVVVVLQTIWAPKLIIPLAYDSGGVTTSTVTVPLIAALGLGLAETIPGRSPLLDGFGLVAIAALFPIISVLTYAQLTDYVGKRGEKQRKRKDRSESDLLEES
jgi:membrane protein implicated in regulation of membrane protease activity